MQKKIKYIIAFIIIVFVLGTPIILLSYIYLEQAYHRNEPPTTPDHNASIYINGNPMFAAKAASEGWNGNGTSDSPYIIEYYNISASSVNGIEIRNTDVYFIVQNVSITNGLSNYFYGFYLFNVSNGIFRNNSANNNLVGFLLTNSYNNTFSHNVANNNLHGFRFWHSHNNTLVNSTIESNLEYGIYLDNSNYNNITGNMLFYNEFGSIVEISSVGNHIQYNVYNPETFFLRSDSGGFDADGTFTLNWTASANADNYTLYQNGVILAQDLTTRSYKLTNLALGTYKYYVRAYNIHGYTDSNTFKVIVKFSINIDGNQDFHQTAIQDNFTGDGSLTDPYLIENYEIDATKGQGVYIKNTNLYFTIKNVNVGDGASKYYGFYFENVSNGRLEGNLAFNNRYGFFLKNCINNTLIGNNASKNLNGLTLNCSSLNNLTSNIITNNRYGFNFESSSNNSVSSNEVKSNHYLGFYLSSSTNNTFKKNNATGNLNGFTLSSSNFNTFLNNNADNNNASGFLLLYSHNNTIRENSASHNQKYGIYLQDSSDNMIFGNTLIGNGLGTIYERILNNKIYPNVFFIAGIAFLIGICLYIAFICYISISKKEITLQTFKKFLIERKKKNS
jgi:parallel beta-helix repeat protein